MRHRILIAGAALAGAVTLTACLDNGESNRQAGQNVSSEQQAVSTGFARLANTQQVPSFDWSQERQTLIDIETLRANGATTTTAGYLEGVGLIWWCPSLGAPVPSTYQLSATTQYIDLPADDNRDLYPVDQGEPTGVYIGQSTGTWTICLDDQGRKIGKYWEGYTDSTTGIVTSYPPEKRVTVTDVGFTFTDKPR